MLEHFRKKINVISNERYKSLKSGSVLRVSAGMAYPKWKMEKIQTLGASEMD